MTLSAFALDVIHNEAALKDGGASFK